MNKRLLIFTFFAFITIAATAGFFMTSLQVTVMDEKGNLQENARVLLYDNKEDFLNEENPVQDPAFTNQKGKVLIKKLDPQPYYIAITKDEMDNFGASDYVDTLKEGRMNKVNVIIY